MAGLVEEGEEGEESLMPSDRRVDGSNERGNTIRALCFQESIPWIMCDLICCYSQNQSCASVPLRML